MKLKSLSLILSCLAAWTIQAASVGVNSADGVPVRVVQQGTFNPVPGQSVDNPAVDQAPSGSLRRRSLPTEEAPSVEGTLRVGGELTVPLFEGKTVTLTLAEQTASPLGGVSFLASTSGADGVKNAVVIQTLDGLQIDIQDYLSQRVYTIFSSKKGVQVDEIRPSTRLQSCGNALEVPPPAPRSSAYRLRKQVVPPPMLATGSEAYVDLLLVYDQLASTWVATHGGAANFAAITVQKMNLALANTGLDAKFRFRLVGVREVAGRGALDSMDGSTLTAILNSITAGGAYNGYDWSVLQTMRDDVGADIVCVLTDTGYDYGVTGLGFSYQASNAAYFSEYAYNCCAIQAVSQGHTLTHEVGHNMGAGHATAVADVSNRGPQFDPYSSGYYFHVGMLGYSTIMAYSSDGYGNMYQGVPYFSSPLHTFGGVAVGDADHNNSRTLENNFLAVSQFRTTMPMTPSTIAFDANGGTPTPPAVTRNPGEPYGTLPVVTRGGYLFGGWFTAPGGGTQVYDTTLTTGDQTLYAHWMAGASSLGAALDATGLSFATGGDAVWFSQSSVSHDGFSAARSGAIGDDETSVLQTEVTGPAEVSFWWRVSSEEGYDELAVLVDDVGQGSISGMGGAWVRKTLPLGAGTHVLKWVYSKDDSWSEGEDCGWVDELTVTPSATAHTISFDANGGVPSPAARARMAGAAYGTLPVVMRDGYVFAGWFTAADGGTKVTASATVTADATLYAHWTPVCYTVSFDANGGAPAPAPLVLESGAAYGALPAVARDGYVFAGWFTAADGGVEVTASTTATADATLYAHWTSRQLYAASAAGIGPGETAPYLDAACVYDGLLVRDGEFGGVIQVKVAKAKRDRTEDRYLAKVTATVQPAGGAKKLAFKGGIAGADGTVTAMAAGGETLSLRLGVDGLGGSLGTWTVDGARNVFAGKSPADQGVSAAVLAAWQGPLNVVGADGVFSLDIAKKGKVKVAGTLQDGTRVSAQGQLLVGAAWCAVPVVSTKADGTAFVVWLPRTGGEPLALGLVDALAGAPGALAAGAVFWCDYGPLFTALYDVGGDLLDTYMPFDIPVRQTGGKWIVADGARAGKVVFLRGTNLIDESKLGQNPSGLKLMYKAKTGSFTGSFKAYSLEGGRIKAYPATVSGVQVGNAGYGFVTVKSLGCTFPARLE